MRFGNAFDTHATERKRPGQSSEDVMHQNTSGLARSLVNIKRRIQSQFENAQNGACAAMVILAGFAFACSAGSQAPTAPSPQPAASATYSLSGTITEAAPTATVPIAGAAVTIGDGPNAGRSATTDSRGVYTISGLQRSGFTINASANGFQPSAKGLTLLADNALDFALSPTPAILSDAQTQRFTDNVGATGCLDVNRRPCFRTTYPVHNAGRFDARLVWTDEQRGVPRIIQRLGVDTSAQGRRDNRVGIDIRAISAHW